jgi:hypothetical protein
VREERLDGVRDRIQAHVAGPGSRSEHRYCGQWQLVTWPPATVTAAAGES